jgi:transcriptional regulator with XRE-family HTH domain
MSDNDDTPKNSALGDVLRKIVDDRGLRQKVLAAKIEITEASLSNILNGKARPRQLTLTRLIDQLQATPEELQRILTAYDHAEKIELPERPASPDRPIPEDEIVRVTRYLEVKSMSVAFRSDVEAVLKRARLDFEKNFRNDPFICDFMLDLKERRVAIDCKYNVNRDWDRTYATVKLLKENLPCDEVVIAIPYENELARKARAEIESVGGQIASLENLMEVLGR